MRLTTLVVVMFAAVLLNGCAALTQTPDDRNFTFGYAEVNSGTTAVASSGVQYLAQQGSTVIAAAGSVVTAHGGSTVYACNGSEVRALSGARVMAAVGARVEAMSGSTVRVGTLAVSCPVPRRGALLVNAFAGVLARGGSVVFAGRGAVVRALSGSTVHAAGGASVHMDRDAIVHADPGADVFIASASSDSEAPDAGETTRGVPPKKWTAVFSEYALRRYSTFLAFFLGSEITESRMESLFVVENLYVRENVIFSRFSRSVGLSMY